MRKILGRDLRRWQFWLPLLALVAVVMLLPFWGYLSASLMAIEPSGLALGIIALLLAIGCLYGLIWSVLEMRDVVKDRRQSPGKLGRPLSILPFAVAFACIQMLVAPGVVLTIHLEKHPSQREWRRVAHELPSVIRRVMFGG